MDDDVHWLYSTMLQGYTIGKDQGKFRWRQGEFWCSWLDCGGYAFTRKYLNPYKEW